MTYKRHPFVRLAFLEKEHAATDWVEVYQAIRRRVASLPDKA
jgi:hypothetical protein